MRVRLALSFLACSLLAPFRALADRNDFVLERLIGRPATPGALNDPTDVSRQTLYKSLMSEMSVVMAPHLLTPADSVGYSGFQLSFDSRFSQVTDSADYWKQGVENVSSNFLSTVTVMARKGLWLPFPSLELAVGGTKLIDSNVYALEASLKFAVHEGFHKWPLPSIGGRVAVSQVLGTPQVSLTVMSFDLTVSKSFGLGGVLKLDPYLGASALLSFVRGQVLDTTPDVDAFLAGPRSTDLNSNTTFADPDPIVRWRVFAGFRLVYGIAAFTGEFAYALCNDTGYGCGRVDAVHVTDRSLGQAQINLSGSLLF